MARFLAEKSPSLKTVEEATNIRRRFCWRSNARRSGSEADSPCVALRFDCCAGATGWKLADGAAGRDATRDMSLFAALIQAKRKFFWVEGARSHTDGISGGSCGESGAAGFPPGSESS